ncbi:MAG TPA: molybdate ABC transporter substrate-binding protein [Pseudolabrys sp.]|jgi:molybdate transport system substrate-binding protein
MKTCIAKICIVTACALLLSGLGATMAGAVEITVLSTQATERAYRELTPQFEKATGHTLKTTFTGTLDVKKRIAAGEPFDLLIMASPDIDAFMTSGMLAAGSRVDLARSGVGVGVKAGAPKPDIATTEAFKKTLLAAKSIGYSTGPSGVYIMGVFDRLGIADQVKPKLKQTPTGVFVGTIVANGEAEIGIQQVSEMSTYPGVDYVGALPAEIQKVTIFSSGIAANGKQAEAAKALVKFLTAPDAAAAFKKRGMEPR